MKEFYALYERVTIQNGPIEKTLSEYKLGVFTSRQEVLDYPRNDRFDVMPESEMDERESHYRDENGSLVGYFTLKFAEFHAEKISVYRLYSIHASPLSALGIGDIALSENIKEVIMNLGDWRPEEWI